MPSGRWWINSNPADDAEKVSVRRSEEFNVLDVDQVHAVARAAGNQQLVSMIVFAAFTGLRQWELLALRWRHVSFPDRIVHVRRNLPAGTSEEDTPKSHRVRSVPLSDQALVALTRSAAGSSSETRMTSCSAARSVGTSQTTWCGTRSTNALKAAGLGHLREKEDPIVWHDLRHVFGTTCAAKGIDLRRIQAWMGHADIQTTMRYLHYVPQHDDAARLTAAFAAESLVRCTSGCTVTGP